MRKVNNLISDSIVRIEDMTIGDNDCYINTGFCKFDELTSGLQKGDLITIGSRPSIGKTSMALNLAKNISVHSDKPVLFFSLEAKINNIILKLISAETGLSLSKLRNGVLENYEWEILNTKTESLKKAPFYIDDSGEISIELIESRIENAVKNDNVKVVIVDYLQLITISGKNSMASNREQYVSIIVRKLKALAKNYDIPIVLFSQLSRTLETRGGSKRPILCDLRESGAIEDDSDLVCFLYRPEYYKIDEWDDDEHSPTQGQAELIVAKNRNGRLENIRLKFTESKGKFEDLEDFSNPFEFKSNMSKNEALNDSMEGSVSSEGDNDVPF
ncbi:DnaB-like helicase C-terminal domain-containing protein [Cellulophaga sp. 20_2_10]|uniref:DnaB-like helicase C-terminal domain-containing protein n=1 Tax=Cellulophaga sp. 20_2_10 TaxID=2942476 RepID=UPI00201AA0AA|nr:DnaB-like helicase C-terminal domain-containing protein [Cellulophaga sp. 20_2_10]MCL5246905.1 DnaB-like helicase C-terminal domain-containing protein [Cellulophaga sp. 20_2_10]